MAAKYLLFTGIAIFLSFLFIPFHISSNDENQSTGGVDIKIPRTTKVLDSNTLLHLSFISEDRYVLIFDDTTPIIDSLSPGDVIVGGVSEATPYGLPPRRVTVVVKKGKKIIVRTKPSRLEDAIEKGTIRMRGTLSPDN